MGNLIVMVQLLGSKGNSVTLRWEKDIAGMKCKSETSARNSHFDVAN